MSLKRMRWHSCQRRRRRSARGAWAGIAIDGSERRLRVDLKRSDEVRASVHRRPEASDLYAHPLPGADRDAAQRIGDLLSGSKRVAYQA